MIIFSFWIVSGLISLLGFPCKLLAQCFTRLVLLLDIHGITVGIELSFLILDFIYDPQEVDIF